MTKLFSLILSIFTVLGAATCPHIAIADNLESMGVVDSFAISSTSGDMEFTAIGWVGASKPKTDVMSLTVELGSDVIYEGRFDRFERPDVVNATGHKDWLLSGWRITAAIPSSVKNGAYDLHVRAKINDGTSINLGIDNPQTRTLTIKRVSASRIQRIFFGLYLTLALGSLYTIFVKGERLAEQISLRVGKKITAVNIAFALICAAFMGLVSLGITGSSLKVLYDQSPFIDAKLDRIALFEQPIRSDEWLVSTPLAIGQVNHQPPFPVINRNLGPDGQNMMVIAFTGVPVNHISEFAKPATWGFHLFDLKRALAWYWWFPFFGCFLALWWLFNLLTPANWRLGAGMSLLFCISPYAVAWTYWPAYVVFFPTMALCSLLLILRHRKWLPLTLLGGVLGLAVAGFVLILYPPWQVSLGYLFLTLGLGLIIRDRAELTVDGRTMAALGFAALIATTILWAWWVDSKFAIEAMMNTVYPGKRQMLTGGGMSLTDIVRGFSNIGSLYRLEGDFSNHSEIASFNYLFLPLIVAIGFRLRGTKNLFPIALPLMVFMVFSLIYMIHGVPPSISNLTLWSRVPSQRADLALGLVYTILCGLALSSNKSTIITGVKSRLFAYLAAFLWVVAVIYALTGFPKGILSGFTMGVIAALLVSIYFSGLWLILGNPNKFILLSFTVYAATTIPFNPLSFAPEKVAITKEVRGVLERNGGSESSAKRVLVLGSQIPAMALISAGVPTVNGVFHYPQVNFWQKFGIDKSETDIINRYQHLIFVVGTVNRTNGFLLESPQPDVVRVTVDAQRFDFGITGAQLVMATQGMSSQLEQNSSLRLVRFTSGWVWFDVIGSNLQGKS